MPDKKQSKQPPAMPSAEEVQRELAKVENIDDFFGKDGVFARLFGDTLTEMVQGELSAELGYEKYEAQGRNTGNSRNGSYKKKVKTSAGEVEVEVPRDRNGDYEPQVLKKYQASSNELEDKLIAMYAKGMTTRDIEDHLREMYGIEASAATISTITHKVIPLVENGGTVPWSLNARSSTWMRSIISCAKTTKSRTVPSIINRVFSNSRRSCAFSAASGSAGNVAWGGARIDPMVGSPRGKTVYREVKVGILARLVPRLNRAGSETRMI